MNFHQQLVLKDWMHRFFRGDDLQKLKQRLGDDRYEGLAEDGQSRFFHEIDGQLFDIDLITSNELRRYDLNIVEHWADITRHRSREYGFELRMKYFQYLSLLFSEIYLDWFFNRKDELLAGLNEQLAAYNEKKGMTATHIFQPYQESDLNKIAFWNATGSGKTLLLHINLRQYLHYFKDDRPNGKSLPDKIILLTPNEGLSRQHYKELHDSGFGSVNYFDKDYTAIPGTIEIIDVNKLADTMGDKTVAVEAFQGNNLVLVDEGHRGTGSEAGPWMRRRQALIGDGFAFEYSATFGQSVGKGKTIKKAEEEARKLKAKVTYGTTKLTDISKEQMALITLTAEETEKARYSATRENYAKCTLFDYSYKYFYDDGYGKDFTILNLPEDDRDEQQAIYFTACLLSFYQQLYLFETQQAELAEFNLEKPLWVFVGNKVNDDDGDVITVLLYLATFLKETSTIQGWIKDLVEGNARILDSKDRNIFDKRFLPLSGKTGKWIYTDILKRLFNTDVPQRLKLANVKGVKGEIALRIGSAVPFGVINIGDDSKFINIAEERTEFDTMSDEFGGSLFSTINKKGSDINLLIGSRKFTEGWSSWRVSTMGLLNMGKGAGPQIIQLFGRGVRLKGRGFTLRRTEPNERPKGLHLHHLETLNIFGVRANYMAKFKEYLKEEGVNATDEMLQLEFPTRPNLPSKKLKTLKLKDGYKDNQKHGFKQSHTIQLYDIPEVFIDAETKKPKLKKIHITLDLYPRIEALLGDEGGAAVAAKKQAVKIKPETMKHFDWSKIYLAVQEHKMRQSWHNLQVCQDKIRTFCETQTSWYTLLAPESDMELRKYTDILKQQETLIQLLLDYTDRFYNILKDAYKGQHYEVISLEQENGSMLKMYNFSIQDTDGGQVYMDRLTELKQFIEDGDMPAAQGWSANQMIAICFDAHLYYPLFHLPDKKTLPLKMRPLSLDAESEYHFVKDLEQFTKTSTGKKCIGNRNLYLLRNASHRSKGIGFASAGNFYPDFLLWLVCPDTGKQWLNFVDPKGIRNIDLEDPKMQLFQEINNVEKALGDKDLCLNSFILSWTEYAELVNLTDQTKKVDLEDRNLLFMKDDPDTYLVKLFDKMG